MENLENKIKEIIIDKLGIEESEITESASFTNDLGADSLDTVELIMEFEKEFNVSIPDEDAEKIGTVGDAISYLKDMINNKNGFQVRLYVLIFSSNYLIFLLQWESPGRMILLSFSRSRQPDLRRPAAGFFSHNIYVEGLLFSRP